MNIKQKLRKNSTIEYNTISLEHLFEGDKKPTKMTFRIKPISLGDILKSAVGFPSLYSIIEGAAAEKETEELDAVEQMKRTTAMVEAFEILISLSVELDVDGEWVGFAVEDDGESLTAGMLPVQIVSELGQAVVTSFRLSIR